MTHGEASKKNFSAGGSLKRNESEPESKFLCSKFRLLNSVQKFFFDIQTFGGSILWEIWSGIRICNYFWDRIKTD